MTNHRLFLAAMVMATVLSPAAPAEGGGRTPQIWVNAFVQENRKVNKQWEGIRTDAIDQWRPDAPWPTVAAHTQVAKLIASNIGFTRDEDLRATIEEVKRRHLELALEIGPLVRSAECGSWSEAYGPPGDVEKHLQRIRSNGGELRYVAMDEPFWYGHRDPSGCRLSAAQLAQQLAATLASMRRIFPGLQLGDIEVVNGEREWISELAQWADAYRAATGEPLAFLHADVAWSEAAIHNLGPLAGELAKRHIPFGIIYTAADVVSEMEWTESAVRHFVEIEQILNIHPDAAIFGSWTRYPTYVMPENKPGTLMNVPLQYLRPSASLRLSRSGQEITGTLSGQDGAAIGGAAIDLTAIDVGGRLAPTARHLASTVPAGAATAIVGIRVGLEGACVCAGPTTAVVGAIHYKEQGRPQQDIPPIQSAPTSLLTLPLAPGRTFAPNLKQFPVTPSAAYTFDTSIAATAAADRAGYVTVVFLDGTGKGFTRVRLWFTPSTQPLTRVETDARGAFSLRLPENIASARPAVRAEWAGSASLRPAMAILPP
jgi:hypothetical protein